MTNVMDELLSTLRKHCVGGLSGYYTSAKDQALLDVLDEINAEIKKMASNNVRGIISEDEKVTGLKNDLTRLKTIAPLMAEEFGQYDWTRFLVRLVYDIEAFHTELEEAVEKFRNHRSMVDDGVYRDDNVRMSNDACANELEAILDKWMG